MRAHAHQTSNAPICITFCDHGVVVPTGLNMEEGMSALQWSAGGKLQKQRSMSDTQGDQRHCRLLLRATWFAARGRHPVAAAWTEL